MFPSVCDSDPRKPKISKLIDKLKAVNKHGLICIKKPHYFFFRIIKLYYALFLFFASNSKLQKVPKEGPRHLECLM